MRMFIGSFAKHYIAGFRIAQLQAENRSASDCERGEQCKNDTMNLYRSVNPDSIRMNKNIDKTQPSKNKHMRQPFRIYILLDVSAMILAVIRESFSNSK